MEATRQLAVSTISESSNQKERSSVSVCELRELHERLRTACIPAGKVSEQAAFAVKPPGAAKGKLGQHQESTSSVSTLAPDTGSDLPGLEFGAEPVPKQFGIHMGVEEYNPQGKGTLQREPDIAASAGVAAAWWPPLSALGAARASPKQVPRYRDLAEDFKSAAGADDPVTTLMVRNIPHRYTRHALIVELGGLGFAGAFDFFYLPLDKESMFNLGYAFVNFINESLADSALKLIAGYKFKLYRKRGGNRSAAVSVAHIQGLERNMQHYKDSAVLAANSKQRCPVVVASLCNMLGGET